MDGECSVCPAMLRGADSLQRPRGTRLWHNIALVILTTSTVAYFAMASDLGATPVTTEFSRGNPGSTRQIWVR